METLQLPETMPDGKPGPKISIVTPSYNQGQFLEETIRSVLLQGYPNLEYIIIDGGSTDNSIEIIRKYEPWLTYWISERDRGQSHAICKGFEKATGEILGWLNSDDILMPGVLHIIGRAFSRMRDSGWITGGAHFIDENGKLLNTIQGIANSDRVSWLLDGYPYYRLVQPSTFWRKELFNRFGPLDETLHFAMDRDLFLSFMWAGYYPVVITNILSGFRIHGRSKTSSESHKFLEEDNIIRERYVGSLNTPELARYHDFMRREKAKLHYTMAQEHYMHHHFFKLAKELGKCFRASPWYCIETIAAYLGRRSDVAKYISKLLQSPVNRRFRIAEGNLIAAMNIDLDG